MGLNFPIKRPARQKVINKANLGMDFEAIINESNEYYLNNDIAVIHKKPTPVQIVKVDYPMRSKAVITEAYYKTPSTTDYNGLYRGKYIDFEAKENHNKTAFPLANIHPHQILHLHNIVKHGGIGFMIFYWAPYNECYILTFDIVEKYWNEAQEGGRKSIPYDEFLKSGHLVKEGYAPRLPYLKVIDELFFNNK